MKKIMIVDDDISFCENLQYVLFREGYSIVVVHTGKDCLSKTLTEKPDLILMDLMLPDGDGSVFVKQMLERPGVKLGPVAFLTALVGGGDHQDDTSVLVKDKRFPIMAKMSDGHELIRRIKGFLG
ncbi:MAG: response regulator [Candidatus Omnitrophota bacterium]